MHTKFNNCINEFWPEGNIKYDYFILQNCRKKSALILMMVKFGEELL